MTELFERERTVITKHINNIFNEKELDEKSNVHFLHIPNSDKPVKIYSLDVIISVGYRIKSQRGTEFRIRANKILKDYLLKGYAINNRVDKLEHRMYKVEEQLECFIEKALPRQSGIFFDGEVFDAHIFVIDLVKLAKRRIILIDNYVDETVLTILAQRKKNLPATIYTEKVEQPFSLAFTKHNAQYPKVDVKVIQNFHDRFLIIDEQVYHIGASIKDLGKRVFAFSKLGLEAEVILAKLPK